MGPAATAAHQQQLNEDHRQALVLFSIVIIFLVTNSPRILINIDEVKHYNKRPRMFKTILEVQVKFYKYYLYNSIITVQK